MVIFKHSITSVFTVAASSVAYLVISLVLVFNSTSIYKSSNHSDSLLSVNPYWPLRDIFKVQSPVYQSNNIPYTSIVFLYLSSFFWTNKQLQFSRLYRGFLAEYVTSILIFLMLFLFSMVFRDKFFCNVQFI